MDLQINLLTFYNFLNCQYNCTNSEDNGVEILENIINWLSNESERISSLKILTLLQKPFFTDSRVINESEYGKLTPYVLKTCKEINLTGASILILFKKLVYEKSIAHKQQIHQKLINHPNDFNSIGTINEKNIEETQTNLQQVIETIFIACKTRKIVFKHENQVAELVNILIHLSVFDDSENIFISDIYWMACDFLIILSEKSNEIRGYLFKLCFDPNILRSGLPDIFFGWGMENFILLENLSLASTIK